MVMLVHLADARKEGAIARSGIVPSRRREGEPWGVFAMPVLPNYFASHQWLRELKRRGVRSMIGVYFRLPDREPVVVGHHKRAHLPMTCARAAALVMGLADARGYEIFLPRKVEPDEIHAFRSVPQIVGWRYFPDAHGKRVCGRPVCVPRGSIRSRALRDAFEQSLGPEDGATKAD